MVKIKKQITPNKNHYAGKNKKKFITVHQTGNPKPGANAAMHAKYMDNGSSETWHYTVDDTQAIQHLEHDVQAWHAGDKDGPGNTESIGVEACVNSDGNYKQTIKNTAETVRDIMAKEDIPLENVVQHNYWSGKDCPRQLRAAKDGISWNDFKQMIDGQEVADKKQDKPASNTTKEKVVQMVIDGKLGNNPARAKRITDLGYNANEIQQLVNARLNAVKPAKKSVTQLAREVIDGKWGNNPQRADRLKKAGYDYNAIQKEVNRLAGVKPVAKRPALKPLKTVAQEVIDGKWGNNPSRAADLTKAGYNPGTVQAKVNELLTTRKPKRKTNDQIAQEVIDGKWGNNPERARKLGAAGYNPSTIQNIVNRKLG